MRYSYELYNYGALLLKDDETGATCFLQGEEASDLYDQLEATTTQRQIDNIISQYSEVME